MSGDEKRKERYMYNDTVTVFARREGMWWPTVIEGTHLITGAEALADRYGWKRDFSAVLLIPYIRGERPTVAGKQVLEPLAWQKADGPGGFLAFQAGEDFGFFLRGVWEGPGPVRDRDFSGGFYANMRAGQDGVWAIAAVTRYGALPHFEIRGR